MIIIIGSAYATLYLIIMQFTFDEFILWLENQIALFVECQQRIRCGAFEPVSVWEQNKNSHGNGLFERRKEKEVKMFRKLLVLQTSDTIFCISIYGCRAIHSRDGVQFEQRSWREKKNNVKVWAYLSLPIFTFFFFLSLSSGSGMVCGTSWWNIERFLSLPSNYYCCCCCCIEFGTFQRKVVPLADNSRGNWKR